MWKGMQWPIAQTLKFAEWKSATKLKYCLHSCSSFGRSLRLILETRLTRDRQFLRWTPILPRDNTKNFLGCSVFFPSICFSIRCIKLAQNFLVSSPVNRNSNSDVFLFSLNHLKILLYIFLHFSWNLRAVKCFLNGFSSDKSKTDFALAGIFALDKTWVKSSFCQCTQQLFPKWDRMFHFE